MSKLMQAVATCIAWSVTSPNPLAHGSGSSNRNPRGGFPGLAVDPHGLTMECPGLWVLVTVFTAPGEMHGPVS